MRPDVDDGRISPIPLQDRSSGITHLLVGDDKVGSVYLVNRYDIGERPLPTSCVPNEAAPTELFAACLNARPSLSEAFSVRQAATANLIGGNYFRHLDAALAVARNGNRP